MIGNASKGLLEGEIESLLRKRKYRAINIDMVLRATQDRTDDFYQWDAKYECPYPALVSDERSEYDYFYGLGLALELALDIVKTLQNGVEGELETEIRRLLRKRKYRRIHTEMVLRAVRGRMEDYHRRCVKYECPDPDFDCAQESEYEYFKGYGLALQLALAIMTIVHGSLSEKIQPAGA